MHEGQLPMLIAVVGCGSKEESVRRCQGGKKSVVCFGYLPCGVALSDVAQDLYGIGVLLHETANSDARAMGNGSIV